MWGSSPRVRGTLGDTAMAGEAQGLIPAGAGNIVLYRLIELNAGAHPRGCGEHLSAAVGKKRH